MKHVGKPYKRETFDDSYDAIVVGSGIGGLTAAALLARYGNKRVLVLERHYTAGGFTHVFKRPGYEWDVGLHYIGEVNQAGDIRRAFDNLTEGRLAWNPLPEVYDRIRIDQRTYEFPSGAGNFGERMKAYFPNDSVAIDKYVALVQTAAKASRLFIGGKASLVLPTAVAGGGARSRFLRFADRTTADVISGMTDNKELMAVLTGQWGDYGLPPAQSSFAIHAIIANHYLEGAGYPIGGASEIAASIAPLIERDGGKIIVDAEVSRILINKGGGAYGVRMIDGREIHSPIIISDAGAYNTFARLIEPALSDALELTGKIAELGPSMSHLCLYVGIKHGDGNAELDGANLWVYPDADHDGNLARFSDDPEAPFPALFISSPSAKDPTFKQRYPGRSTIEVIVPAPYRWFERWSDQRWGRHCEDYKAFKEQLAKRIQTELEKNLPWTAGKICHAELSTPLSTRHFTNYAHGEIYGLPATPARFRLNELNARTPIKNLFLTGQDVATLGVVGALSGGVICASSIMSQNLAAVIFQPSN